MTDEGGGEGGTDYVEVDVEVDEATRVVEGWLETDDVDGFLDELGETGARYSVAGQAFDASRVASSRHLRFAAAKARRAFRGDENVADTLAMEVMLYTAGTRQISRATEVGVRAGGCGAAVSLTPTPDSGAEEVPEEAVEAVEDLLEPGDVDYIDVEGAREQYEVTDEEVEAVGERKLELLVLERTALLEVNK